MPYNKWHAHCTQEEFYHRVNEFISQMDTRAHFCHRSCDFFFFFFFFESDCSSLVLLFVLLLFCQCTHHFFLGVSADVADVSLCYCVAQILEAKSSCAKDYDVCAVTDVVLLFSKCQVFGYNHPRHRVHEERFLENGKGDETCW